MERLNTLKSVFVPCLSGNLEDSYSVIKSLGSGTYGNTLLVKHRITQQLRAAKRIPKVDQLNLERIVAEFTILKQCDHPNIVKIYEVLENETHVFLIMEYCEGGELLSFIKAGLNETQAVDIIRQAASAIAYIHSRGICHRDIKPENMMLVNGTLKLIDFGLAQICNQQLMSSRVGSICYISPEVLNGSYTQSCDIWSLGVVLFLMLSGKFPFYGRSADETIRRIKMGEFSFDVPAWSYISGSAKDLIVQMLVADEVTRISAMDILRHPWLSATGPIILVCESDKFISYYRAPRLRQLALTYLAYHSYETEIIRLSLIFRRLDTDCDGLITLQELLHSVGANWSQSEMQRASLCIGSSPRRQMEYSEFLAAFLETSDISKERLYMAFKQFDYDGTNTITAKKLHTVLGEAFKDQDWEFWESMIEEADVYANGDIDFADFVSLVLDSQD